MAWRIRHKEPFARKGQAMRAFVSRCEEMLLIRNAVPVAVAEEGNPSGSRLADQHVAIGRDGQPARILQSLGEEVDGKARRHTRHPVRAGNAPGPAVHTFGYVGRRQFRRLHQENPTGFRIGLRSSARATGIGSN